MLKKIIFFTIFITILIFISCSDDDSTTAPDPLPGYRVVEIIEKEYDWINNVWNIEEISNINYDDLGRMISVNSINYTFVDEYMATYHYPNNSTVLPSYFCYYDQVKGWVIYSKFYCSYDEGKIKDCIGYSFDDIGDSLLTWKRTCDYSDGLIIAMNSYINNDGNLELRYIGEWIYESGRLTEHLSGSNHKEEYLYENDKLSEIRKSYFDSISFNTWSGEIFSYENDDLSEKLLYWIQDGVRVDIDKLTYQFTNGYLSSRRDYVWYDYHSVWMHEGKTDYFFDDNGNFLGYTEYGWSSQDSIYFPSFKREMIYEEGYGNYSELIKIIFPEDYYTGLDFIELSPIPGKKSGKQQGLLELLPTQDYKASQ